MFYREGVRAVGIDRVLAEADAAKASLYQHFGCKDHLVASYLERRTVDARANIEAYLADTPPSQRALKFFDCVVEWAESKDFRGCPLQHTVSELTDSRQRNPRPETIERQGRTPDEHDPSSAAPPADRIGR